MCGVLSGTKVVAGQFAGGPLDWLNPFSITVGMALIAGYTLLGSTYLILKTVGPVQKKAYQKARRAGWIVLGCQVLVTLWTPFHYPSVLANWFSSPRIYFMWTFPVMGLLAFYGLMKSLKIHREVLPFACSVLLFLAGYFGLIASIYPYVVPPSITFQEAAAQHETLRFTLIGVIIILPVVLGYTLYSYFVFRGKVDQEKYYH